MTEARSIDLGSKTHPSDSGFTDREWWLISLAALAIVPLTAQSVDEIFLTAAQSLFGTVFLLTPRFRIRDAVALAVLFFIQFFVPIERVHLVLAWFYIALTGLALVLNWRDIRAAGVW